MAQSKNWQKAENKANKAMGAIPTPRSGAGPTRKGDGYTATDFIETKSSQCSDRHGPYMTVHAAWFRKAKRDALLQGLDPVVVLTFGKSAEYQFFYRYAPLSTVRSILSYALDGTMKVCANDMELSEPDIIIDGEVWTQNYGC